jgi:hypothetical protein
MATTLYTPAGDPVEVDDDFAHMIPANPRPDISARPLASIATVNANWDRREAILLEYFRRLGFSRGDARSALEHEDYWLARALA